MEAECGDRRLPFMVGFTAVPLRDSCSTACTPHSQLWPTSYTPSKGMEEIKVEARGEDNCRALGKRLQALSKGLTGKKKSLLYRALQDDLALKDHMSTGP